MLEEESGNWSPTPGLDLTVFGVFFGGKQAPSLPVGKLHGEWQAPVLQQSLEALPLLRLGPSCGVLGASFLPDGFQSPGLTSVELS